MFASTILACEKNENPKDCYDNTRVFVFFSYLFPKIKKIVEYHISFKQKIGISYLFYKNIGNLSSLRELLDVYILSQRFDRLDPQKLGFIPDSQTFQVFPQVFFSWDPIFAPCLCEITNIPIQVC